MWYWELWSRHWDEEACVGDEQVLEGGNSIASYTPRWPPYDQTHPYFPRGLSVQDVMLVAATADYLDS